MALFNIPRMLHLYKRLSNDLSGKTTQGKPLLLVFSVTWHCHDRIYVYIIGNWVYFKVPNLDFNVWTIWLISAASLVSLLLK